LGRPRRQAEILNALVCVTPTDPNAPTQIVKLDDDQVRLILNQLTKTEANARRYGLKLGD
jgi:hypothetical protein